MRWDEELEVIGLESCKHKSFHELLIDFKRLDHGRQHIPWTASAHFLALHPLFLLRLGPEHYIKLFFRWASKRSIIIVACVRANTVQVQPPDAAGSHLGPVFLGCHHDTLLVVVLVHAHNLDQNSIVEKLSRTFGRIVVDQSLCRQSYASDVKVQCPVRHLFCLTGSFGSSSAFFFFIINGDFLIIVFFFHFLVAFVIVNLTRVKL